MHQGVHENINLNLPTESDIDHLMGVPPIQQCKKIKQLACKLTVRIACKLAYCADDQIPKQTQNHAT